MNELQMTDELSAGILENYERLERIDERHNAICLVDQIISRLKETKKELERKYIERHRHDKLVIDDKMVVVGEVKKTKFNTQLIYDACDLEDNPAEVLKRVLGKNPVFRKTELEKLQENFYNKGNMGNLWEEDCLEKIEIKTISKRYLKGRD